MAITINIYYKGKAGSAQKFMNEMITKGIVDDIKRQKGNICYDYFQCIEDMETILLIDSWENQEALDTHHLSPMMSEIINLREKYNLAMRVERYISANEQITKSDRKYIK